jgi:hypothetical protein
MQRDGDAVGRDVDPLDQQPQYPRLLGRVQLVPDRLERAEAFDDIALLELVSSVARFLLVHRDDRPRGQLGRREQPSDLPEHEALHLAGGDWAHRAGVVAPAARARHARGTATFGGLAADAQ